ncbi:DUF1904 domain-containing protein [Paenibacillus spongiae]|uniref:DUF1904 domain-containing protein n=1 Tax=Paenibacillus spongiae TaxID=2909671 RepID=A0ABY5SAZ1_9BACL|nr:DUF1904 domain-containing protein [Paenibacillus spongiae]UVI31116.1 DUF1904 domain-containing protein [Paenibacillus spongiae]
MPQLTVRGMALDRIASISGPLVHELAEICGCGTDNFTIDLMQVISVFEGQQTETYPFIEVAWFERGPAVRDRLADAITRHVRKAGVAEVEVAFKVYSEDAYYINGQSCGS